MLRRKCRSMHTHALPSPEISATVHLLGLPGCSGADAIRLGENAVRTQNADQSSGLDIQDIRICFCRALPVPHQVSISVRNADAERGGWRRTYIATVTEVLGYKSLARK
ncbi:hypothetical protein BV20DRAFT_273776 [Pilatotrama ljubarskyi]|nr:hypothetical protein BV20DRAFT_273776 [Pilatotrama ljubarskyi]